jgi:hypothetical protein
MDVLAAVLPYVTVTKRVFSLLAIVIPILLMGLRALNKREPAAV